MKKFTCGDVVPGCDSTFIGESEDEILGSVALHAAEDHGVSPVPPAMVEQVRLSIVAT